MPGNDLSRIDFSDNRYTLKQKTVRNAYKLYDSSDNEILSAKQKLFKMKEEFPFKNPQGKDVFTVKAEQIMDIAGDYAITDADTGEKVAVLEKDFDFLMQTYWIQDPEGNELAKIQSRGKALGAMKALFDFLKFIPNKYTIENNEGKQVGTINGKFGIRDKYIIDLDEDAEDREAIMAAAVTIDALEGD